MLINVIRRRRLHNYY